PGHVVRGRCGARNPARVSSTATLPHVAGDPEVHKHNGRRSLGSAPVDVVAISASTPLALRGHAAARALVLREEVGGRRHRLALGPEPCGDGDPPSHDRDRDAQPGVGVRTGAHMTTAGAIRRDTRFITLISGLMAGPAVSLNGSPTVSPMTVAACASEPLPPWLPSSTSFLALSQAPPELARNTAISTPTAIAPAR